MTDFDFFERTLVERRAYDYSAGTFEMVQEELARLTQLYPAANIPQAEDGPIGPSGFPSLVVSHAFIPSLSGAQVIQDELNIQLPGDFLDFYSQWEEGLLSMRNPILLRSSKVIIDSICEIREIQGTPSETLHHTIPFGQSEPNCYFALRRKPSMEVWEVYRWLAAEYPAHVFQSPDYEGLVTDTTFTEWLRRMIETDGAPLHPSYSDDSDDFFNKRVF